MNDLQNIWRMLEALDQGQLEILKQVERVQKQQDLADKDRGEMKRLLAKLDDPDYGRVAQLEQKVKTLMKAMDIFTKIRDRGIGGLTVIGIVLILFGAGVTEAVKKVAALLIKGG